MAVPHDEMLGRVANIDAVTSIGTVDVISFYDPGVNGGSISIGDTMSGIEIRVGVYSDWIIPFDYICSSCIVYWSLGNSCLILTIQLCKIN